MIPKIIAQKSILKTKSVENLYLLASFKIIVIPIIAPIIIKTEYHSSLKLPIVKIYLFIITSSPLFIITIFLILLNTI